MKKAITTTLFLFLVTVFCFGQKTEEKLVIKSFDSYKSAILNDKGEEAVKYVDSRTLKYYNDIAELSRNADSAEVSSMSILDKLMVFSIRHRASKSEVLSFDGKSLLIYAIQNGMVGKNSVANNSIGKVTIDSNFATGQFIANGQKTPINYHFYKEAGQWKLDLTSLFPVSIGAFQKMVDESGQNENEYLFYLLELVTGRKPGKEIWQPLQ